MELNPIRQNVTELEMDGMTILFSYKTPVAVCITNEDGRHLVNYTTEKKWSNTTSRHISQWLGEAVATKNPQEYFDNLVSSVGGK